MDAIEIYRAKNGGTQVEVHFENETVWLSQKEITSLFDRDRTVITKHINNIFKEDELDKNSVCAFFAHTAADGKIYKIERYNLDVIISVGYRVKSKRGTQFRQWATQRLKEHLVIGYTINQKRLEQLQQTIQIIHHSGQSENLSLSEAKGLLDIITNYTQSFIVLNQYDSNSLVAEKLNENITYEIKYDEAEKAIAELKKQLIAKKQATEIFGNQKDESFKGILGNIVQSFDGEYLSFINNIAA